MSKKRRKGLFGDIQDQNKIRQDNVETIIDNNQVNTTANDSFSSSTDKKLMKSELLSVFSILVVVILSFTTLWYTNTKNSWIEILSDRIMNIIVK